MTGAMGEMEFGLPTIEQLYGGQLGAGSGERIRRWLDDFYAAERSAGSGTPRINRSITEGWLRRRCREEYLSMGLGGAAIAAEHAACREAADWYRRQGLVTLSRRAEIRAEAAREIAQGIAA